MRKTTLLLLSGVFAVSAFGGAVQADQGADKGPGLFQRADKDGDGFVTKLEFADSRAGMFKKIDANGDAVLDQDELTKAREAFHQKMGKLMPQGDAPEGKKRHSFMQRADANEDGKISSEEFTAAGEKMFARLDDNGDGKLAKDEMPKRRKHQQDQPPAQ